MAVFSSSAQNADYIYTNNNGTITITKYTGSGGAVSIPSTIDGLPVTSIGDWAFAACQGLTGVSIPDSVTNIGRWAFIACSMTDVTIGSGVTSIENEAFYGCSNLTSVIIPSHVTSIGSMMFEYCTRLTNITVAPLNPSYSSAEGVLFNRNQTKVIQCPGGKEGSYAIPNGVTVVNERAFTACFGLGQVIIPESVTNIGAVAFASSGLTRVDIPNGVTEIAEMTFSNCSSLTNVVMGNAITSIGDWAFAVCGKLTEATIPNKVTNIEEFAFYSCSNMTSVTISESVSTIGHWAFGGCALTNVTLPASVTTIGDGLFLGCSNLSAAYFKGNAPIWIRPGPNGVKGFGGSSTIILYHLPGTTGWTDTFANRPTGLWVLPNPVILTTAPDFGIQNDAFGFTISWTTNASVVVEACSNLANASWSPISTNTLVGGSSYFSDPGWTNYPTRFYRLRSP